MNLNRPLPTLFAVPRFGRGSTSREPAAETMSEPALAPGPSLPFLAQVVAQARPRAEDRAGAAAAAYRTALARRVRPGICADERA